MLFLFSLFSSLPGSLQHPCAANPSNASGCWYFTLDRCCVSLMRGTGGGGGLTPTAWSPSTPRRGGTCSRFAPPSNHFTGRRLSHIPHWLPSHGQHCHPPHRFSNALCPERTATLSVLSHFFQFFRFLEFGLRYSLQCIFHFHGFFSSQVLNDIFANMSPSVQRPPDIFHQTPDPRQWRTLFPRKFLFVGSPRYVLLLDPTQERPWVGSKSRTDPPHPPEGGGEGPAQQRASKPQASNGLFFFLFLQAFSTYRFTFEE